MAEMKTQTRNNKWMWIIVAIYLFLIWHNSMETGTASGSLSRSITLAILPWVEKTGFTVPFDTLHFYVRKLAHFSEYFVLALLVYPAGRFNHKSWPKWVLWPASSIIDESIQHFVPGRYGCIRDVCIDMTGYITGIFIAYLVRLMINDLKNG
ncbi:VanZ family protein [Lactimicrobium massiliense]|jgi:VanZ family protein|uniref:VanZ family protein n=1 Tax=Lactimicrobium massiliense TaxID=2161814 RepID=UPI000D55EC38|nr:VanZ family protein [Lactimicrobium massiliense]